MCFRFSRFVSLASIFDTETFLLTWFSCTSEELDFDLAFDGLIDTAAGARDSPLIDVLKSK